MVPKGIFFMPEICTPLCNLYSVPVTVSPQIRASSCLHT
nr:MAG TPA: hypothetical protein [Caudoviricetes sp.]